MKSEFPETKFTKYGKKFGWIFSPLLFIFLLIYTLFTAQNLSFDPLKGDISKYGNVHVKEVSESDVFFDGKLVGRSSSVLKTDKVDSTQSLSVKVVDQGKRDWEKIVKPREGYVSILFPIMYPPEIEFNEQEFSVNSFYKSPNPNIFFYEKIEGENINLYRYEAQSLLFTINIRNDRFADISRYAKKSNFSEEITNGRTISNALNERKIYPGYLGRRVALVRPGDAIYIINENGSISTVPDYVPKSNDTLTWSPDDEYLVIGNSREILSFGVSSNTINVIHRADADEQLELQFSTINAIIYKIVASTSIDLYENNYQGNNRSIVDIPNIDGLRRNNLNKVFDLIEKHNSLLIQATNNIYLFNLATFELKKFNKFDGEEVILADSEWEVVITSNKQTKNQFRYYNIESNDSRTFTFDKVDITKSPNSIQGFNYSQNLAFTYDNRILFSDADGANQMEFSSSLNPQTVITVKEDRNVLLGLAEINTSTDKDLNPLKLRFERFEN